MGMQVVQARKEDLYPCYLCEKDVPKWQEHLLPIGTRATDIIRVCPTCYSNYFGFTSGD